MSFLPVAHPLAEILARLWRRFSVNGSEAGTVSRTCSTSGGEAKQWPTSLRHSWKSAEPRKSTVWFSTVSHLTNSR